MRLIKIAVLCLVLAASAYALYNANSPKLAKSVSPPAPVSASSTTVACQGNEILISNGSAIPKLPNIDSSFAVNVDSFQCGFDGYSWDLFLALNHDAQGNFVTGNDGTPTVWEEWAESSDIFLPDGAKPASGGGSFPPREVPAECTDLDDGKMRVVRQVGKRPDVLEEFTQPFDSGPLIDVNGNYSRFAISVNKPMYDYILNNELYSKAGQKAFSDAGNVVNFSCSCNPDSTGEGCSTDGQQGAVMVKAAWKVIDLDAGDNPDLFHTVDALIYTEASVDGSEPATCAKQPMGLTGFHIAQKNHGDTQWLWSTFEHVNNVPTQNEGPVAGTKYNYFSQDCGDDCNAVNKPPAQPWNPHNQPVTAAMGKSQIERVIPIEDQTIAMNTQVQTDLLAGTVWANYELISTQWPTAAATPGANPVAPSWCTPINEIDKSGNPAPAFLANTTLETYIQGTTPQASSSCINCHLNATMTDGEFSDFTYLLERAQGRAEGDSQ